MFLSFSEIKLEAPENITAEPVSNGIKLGRDEVKGATSYQIYRKDGDNWKRIAHAITKTSYADKTDTGKKVCCYKVVAVNGTVGKSGEKSDFVRGLYLGSIAAPSLSAQNGSISVKWMAIEGADYYGIYRKEAGGDYSRLAIVKEDTDYTRQTWEDDKVTPGKTYYYYIEGYKKKGDIYVCGTFGKNAASVTAKANPNNPKPGQTPEPE